MKPFWLDTERCRVAVAAVLNIAWLARCLEPGDSDGAAGGFPARRQVELPARPASLGAGRARAAEREGSGRMNPPASLTRGTKELLGAHLAHISTGTGGKGGVGAGLR